MLKARLNNMSVLTLVSDLGYTPSIAELDWQECLEVLLNMQSLRRLEIRISGFCPVNAIKKSLLEPLEKFDRELEYFRFESPWLKIVRKGSEHTLQWRDHGL